MDKDVRIGVERREETILVLTDYMIRESNEGLEFLKKGDIVASMHAQARAAAFAQRISQLKTEIQTIQEADRRERGQEFLSDIYKNLGIDGIEIRVKF